METKYVILNSLIVIFVTHYFVHTAKFAIAFDKNIFFAGWKKIFHSVMIWLVPYLWIFLLKGYMTPLPGTATSRKYFSNSKIKNTGLGIWHFLILSDNDANNSSQFGGDNANDYNGGYYNNSDGDSSASDSGGADSSGSD